MEQKMTLYAIDGDYGLASLDLECLKSILYAKIMKVPLQVLPLNCRSSCTFYSAATLKTASTKVEGFSEIVQHLQETLALDIDSNLTSKQKSEALALTNLVTMKLGPAYEFMHWIEEHNRDKLTRWFIKSMPFPHNRFFTRRKYIKAKKLMEVLYPMDPLDENRDVLKEFVISAATLCLIAISTRLGTSQYFFGDSPTMLDITVYSYIAPFVKFPFPTNEMNALFSMWPNLVEFVKRIDAKYLSEYIGDVKHLKEELTVKASDDEVCYMGIFIIASVTLVLSMNLAVKRGLFNKYTTFQLW